MLIDILCKVVDNYGDIGVAYRLARALAALPEAPRLRLIVDELSAFAALDPSVDPTAERQVVHGWEVFGWELSPAALEAFAARPTRILVQCFACPRPDWLESLLFDPTAEKSLIVDLEYLSAEPYAAELHRMPSLTRSANVRKAMFLPGFAPGTGGLVIDPPFAAARDRAAEEGGRVGMRRELLAHPRLLAATAGLPPEAAELFWISVFSYERDYARIVADMAAFHERLPRSAEPGSGSTGGLLVLVAAGKSRDCFLSAWREAGEPFPVLELPFLPQEAWDRALLACDFSIVRGEDSWARAALSGKPFLWQAYPQEGRHQMVKVEAFLSFLRPYLPAEGAPALESLYASFNDRDLDAPSTRGDESLLPVLERYSAIAPAFRALSGDIASRGDLASNLMTFLREML